MRVLLVHNRYRRTGGEERHLDLLEASLAAAGAEVSRFELDSSAATRPSRLAAAALLPYNPLAARRVRAEVRRSRAEVVHFHNLWPLLTPAALHGARLEGAKVVLTCHNYRFACPGGTLTRHGSVHHDCLEGSSLACGVRGLREGRVQSVAYGAALALQRRLRMLDRWVDAFVAPAEFVRTALGRAGLDVDRARVIRLGVPAAPATATASAGTYALFAGRLSREKGIDVLLRAARLAPDVPVLLAGSGPLEQAVRRERPGSVELLGHVDQARLGELRAGSRMTLVPSVCYEVSPYAALEAAAAGRTAVASRIGGIPEIVEDGRSGLLVTPGDPTELAAAMQRLWDDAGLASALGDGAAARARRDHDLARAADEHLALYEELLAA